MKRIRQGLQSFRARIVVAAGILLAVALASLALYADRTQRQVLLTAKQAHLVELQNLLGTAIAPDLARGDIQALRALLEQIRREHRLGYLVVTDATGRIAAADGWNGNALPPHAAGRANVGLDGSLAATTSVREGARELGQLYFRLDGATPAQANAGARWSIFAAAAAAFAVGLLLLAWLAAWLTRDLAALKKGMTGLEQGESPAKLPVSANDEIGELTRAFNHLVQTVEERAEALKKSEARFHAIADYTYGVEAWFNPQGRLIWINRSVERVSGYTPLECLLAPSLVDLLIFDKDRKYALEMATRAVRGGTGENFETRLRRKDGEVVWISINWQPIHGVDGEYLGLRVSADEIQARKEAELRLLDTVVELRRAQALKEYYLNHSNEERSRLEALLNVMKVGVLFVDASHRVLYCNRPFRELWGFAPDENLTGTRDVVLVERCAGLRADDPLYKSHLEMVLKNRSASSLFEIPLTDGRTLAEVSALVTGTTPGKYIGRVWIYEDVTEQKRTAEKLIQLAERDPLTNLFNRRRFQEELDRVIADSSRRSLLSGLLAIDLDGFKAINDEYGHQSGDMVLIALSDEVASVVRRNEMFFRVGGDEFVILVPDTSEEQMVGLARRVASKIAELRFDFPGREVRITASLGIALYPTHAQTGEEMIARADHAMYQAKTRGKNCWTIYPGLAVAN